MIKLLHFADAHIDMAGQGRLDPASGLPLRSLDFLTALDKIVNAAVEQQVDLVIFAGDAYKDRTPVPTFQREWGRRMMRLSRAGIRTLLLVGNHDRSPAAQRAHALQEYETLEIPHIFTASELSFWGPDQLEGLPVQVIALPWISRSTLLARLQEDGLEGGDIYDQLAARYQVLVDRWLEQADPGLPVILTAHASVQGAVYGGERAVMLGNDLVLPGSLVRDPRIDYAALGHIHKAQNLNENAHPPVIYPGSIERVDFGEAADDKYYVTARIERGHTEFEWHKLDGRRFIDRYVRLNESNLTLVDGLPSLQDCMRVIRSALPAPQDLEGAVLRLTLEYPRGWEVFIDETELRRDCESAFEFHLLRRPQVEARLRLPGNQAVSQYSPQELLELYWKQQGGSAENREALNRLAAEIFNWQAEGSEESG